MAVEPAQVGVELGVATPSALQLQQWGAWIGDALYLIGKRLDITALDPADVDYVVLRAVVAHAQNPRNETQVTVAVDDASTSRSIRSGAGRVVIPDDLWSLLDPDMVSSIGSLQLYGEPDRPAYDPWASI